MKLRRILIAILAVVMLVATLGLVACVKNKESNSIEVTFSGYSEPVSVLEGNEVKTPGVSLKAGEEMKGWALSATATSAKFKSDTIAYDELAQYATDGKVTLYAVIDATIQVTVKGLEDKTTVLSKTTKNTAAVLVGESKRQQHLGYATTENATEATISKDTVLNYENLAAYADTSAKLVLYPVVKTYDLMIAVHASHSNGNVYVSAEQFAEIKQIVNDYFKDAGIEIYICRFDELSAANFANQVVLKDYDITLSSKTIAEDLDKAQAGMGLASAEDYPMTALTCIDLNQSRQVGLLIGHDNAELYPYAVSAYNLLLTPVDKVLNVKFGSDETLYEVHRTGSEIAPDETPVEPAGKMFVGWAFTENASEVDVSKVTYANVKDHATDGVVTLYPVFMDCPDLYVIVWGVNGENTYVTQDEFNAMVAGFNAYLNNKGVDVTGKKIVIDYSTIKGTSAFYKEIEKSYINIIVGASAISNSTYAEHWTIDKGHYSKAYNFKTENNNRYVGLREGVAEENELAVHFYNYMCSSDIDVTIGDATEKVNSVAKNEVAYTGTIPEGKVLVGYATTENATEAEITKITFANVYALATDGKVTLYPVFTKVDLTVYIWGGQSKTGTTYVKSEEAEALEANFIKLLGDKVEGKNIVFKLVYGKTAEYSKNIGSDADVIISGKNIDDADQCGSLLSGAKYSKVAVANNAFENTTRYVGVTKAAEDNEFAMALLTYLCEKTVTVKGLTAEPVVLSLLQGNEVSYTGTTPEGKVLVGYATTENATEAGITKLDFDSIYALATDGEVTLYPVFENIPEKTPDLVINILCGTASSRYITESEVNSLKDKFVEYLKAQGDANAEKYEIVVRANPGATGANFNASLKGDESVLIAANNLTSQTGFPGLAEGKSWVKVKNTSVIANTSRYAGIVSTCGEAQLALAEKFMAFLTTTATA